MVSREDVGVVTSQMLREVVVVDIDVHTARQFRKIELQIRKIIRFAVCLKWLLELQTEVPMIDTPLAVLECPLSARVMKCRLSALQLFRRGCLQFCI
jgi:hypothetical protein